MSDALLSLIITSVLLLGSPGPVPIALAAAGATVGFRKGLLFMCGILTAFAIIITLAFLGLANLFQQFPIISHVFMVLSSLFLFYIAYKIATSVTLIGADQQKLLSYKTGFIINILNPKAYASVVALLTQFSQQSGTQSTSSLLAGITILSVALTTDTTWLTIGNIIKPLFNDARYQKMIRYFFAGSLAIVVAVSLVKSFI